MQKSRWKAPGQQILLNFEVRAFCQTCEVICLKLSTTRHSLLEERGKVTWGSCGSEGAEGVMELREWGSRGSEGSEGVRGLREWGILEWGSWGNEGIRGWRNDWVKEGEWEGCLFTSKKARKCDAQERGSSASILNLNHFLYLRKLPQKLLVYLPKTSWTSLGKYGKISYDADTKKIFLQKTIWTTLHL